MAKRRRCNCHAALIVLVAPNFCVGAASKFPVAKTVLVVALALALAVPASAAQPPTMIVRPTVIGRVSPPLVFEGTVPGARAGVEVTIEAKGCTDTFYRLFGLTHTTASGSWRWEAAGSGAYLRTNMTFRARANDAASGSVTVRRRVSIALTRVPRTRMFRVGLSSQHINLHGKPIRLERFSGGRWVLVRTARLVRKSYGAHTATFVVRQRGLQLRATIAESLVSRCYAAGVSPIVRS